MKSIQQICQLSDKELKAVLNGDCFSYGELLDQTLDFNRFHKDIEDLASTIYDRLRIGFQVMLEKVIGEEFFTLLEAIADRGGNASRNGVNVNVNLYIFTGVKMYIICSCFLSHQLMGQEWSAVQHTLWS